MPEEILHNLSIKLAQVTTNLESIQKDIAEIKTKLAGSDSKAGLVLDVDRLKSAMALQRAITWVLFTATIGTVVSLLSDYLLAK